MLARLSGQDELRHGHIATFAQAAPVEFDPGDFMKSFGCEVAGTAMWTTDDWYSFDHEQRRAFSVTARYWPNLNARPTTVFAVNLTAVIPHTQ